MESILSPSPTSENWELLLMQKPSFMATTKHTVRRKMPELSPTPRIMTLKSH